MLDLRATNDLCRLLSDATRVRLVALLGRAPLTVAELTRITGLAQSRVSTHLGRLRDGGLVQVRRNGNASYYLADEDAMPGEVRGFWSAVKASIRDPLLADDLERAAALVAARDEGQTWADTVAGQMERHYSPGRTWESIARGLLGFAPLGDVVDVASGDGTLAELIAPCARKVTCIDISAQVVDAGRDRLAHLPHVEFLHGDMHALPLPPAAYDQALLMNALTYARDAVRVVTEAARVLRPGGRLVGVTLNRHGHADAVAPYNHVQLGFEPDALAEMFVNAGLVVERCGVTHREKRTPHFAVITFHAVKPAEKERQQ